MALDGFLELKFRGAPAVTGECRDSAFSLKKAMAIKSFEFGTELGSSSKEDDEDEEDEKTGKKQPEKPKSNSKNPTNFKFSITKDVDSASPALFKAYCMHASAGVSQFDQAIISLRKAGGSDRFVYLVMEFAGVFVSSYTLSATSGDELPEETIEFVFQTSVKFRYQPQTSAGHGAANIKGWNRATNAPI